MKTNYAKQREDLQEVIDHLEGLVLALDYSNQLIQLYQELDRQRALGLDTDITGREIEIMEARAKWHGVNVRDVRDLYLALPRRRSAWRRLIDWIKGYWQDRDENAADNLANAVGYTVQMRALSTEIAVADFEGDQERAIGLLLQMEELVDDELFHRSRRLKSPSKEVPEAFVPGQDVN